MLDFLFSRSLSTGHRSFLSFATFKSSTENKMSSKFDSLTNSAVMVKPEPILVIACFSALSAELRSARYFLALGVEATSSLRSPASLSIELIDLSSSSGLAPFLTRTSYLASAFSKSSPSILDPLMASVQDFELNFEAMRIHLIDQNAARSYVWYNTIVEHLP